MNVLVLGASGLLGHKVFQVLASTAGWRVTGVVRSDAARGRLPQHLAGQAIVAGDLSDPVRLKGVVAGARPDVVINCLSVAKTDLREDNLHAVVGALALLPQWIAQLCRQAGARLVHFSSDGVFSGLRGGYTEEDLPDPQDAYGVAKLLGEVREPHTITIRTSMIGPELGSANGLLEWFLAQRGESRGFTRAIFSGLPTLELARIVRDVIIPRPDLAGVFHVAAAPISKFEVLSLVEAAYRRGIRIVPDDRAMPDRSLDATRFREVTGYRPPDWPALIQAMHADHVGPSPHSA